MKKAMKSGFTLIELLVVVAIIAVIGAGVAVTYNKLDQRAKTAMEINDIGVLTETIKHWSFLHDWAIPNKLDSLIETSGNLYTKMTDDYDGTMQGVSTESNGSYGLYAQAGYTFVAHAAPPRVISNLSAAGLTLVYLHDTARNVANDSTFRTIMGGNVDTANTAATLASTVAGNPMSGTAAHTVESYSTQKSAKDAAQIIVRNESAAADAFAAAEAGGYSTNFTIGATSYSAADWATALADAKEIISASYEVETLAFIDPDKGANMQGYPMGMNMAHEIISNLGLRPDDVARCDEDAAAATAANRKCWLVVFGLGRFASIYEGKGARVDAPAIGKRYSSDPTNYSRYLVVIRVPIEAYDAMTQKTEMARVACVLSPQALSVAALGDNYQEDVNKTSN